MEVSSFCGPNALGNRHKIFIFESEEGYNRAQENYLRTKASGICVFVLISKSHSATIRFYQNQRSIKRCGSGTLAALCALHSQFPQYKIDQFYSEVDNLQLVVDSQEQRFYYETKPPAISKISAPTQWQRFFENDISIETWLADIDNNGYFVAILEDEKSLQTLRINSQALCNLTQRALIVTAAAQDSLGYVIRYFAPQYGNKEDSATGSANALIAPYWLKTLNATSLTAKQLSREGGVIFVSHPDPQDKTKIRVGGECRIHLD